MNIEPITLAIGSLIAASVPAIGALVYARNQWQASNRDDDKQQRQERMDHQSCLEKLSTFVEETIEWRDTYDKKIDAIHEQHRECTQNVSKLTAENESMRAEMRSIRKTISPQPFPKVTP
jgi:peptidoglycan hydrolase CwlO-like protein